jgi:hypothetical protein
MGGIGSGNWYRWDKQDTVEATKRIDIRYMKKEGLLKAGTTGTLRWTIGGEPNGKISYSVFHDHLRLDFRYRKNGEEWQLIEQGVPFGRTPCNYGGERLWFHCPRCNKRVGLLYGHDVLFLCRHCYQLPYASQQEGRLDNLITQKHNIGERIFEYYEYGEGYMKKKGMHQKTFDRLHARYKKLDYAINHLTVRRFNLMGFE